MRGLFIVAGLGITLALFCHLSRAASLADIKPAAPSQVIVDNLTGIVAVNSSTEIFKEGVVGVTGVQTKGVPLLDQPEFKKRLERYLGQPLTKDGRAKIIDDIVVYLRQQGRSLVDVSTPPQDITNGVLQVLVLEGKVGEVRVQGNRWFKSKYLADQLRSTPGGSLNADALREDLEWINRNPFRQVDLVYVKGSELGKADLVLREVDRFPLRVYSGYEDSGTSLTENDRLLAGVNWGNAFGIDGQLGYQFVTSPDFTSFRAHSGSYTQPLPWRHILTVFGSYADVRANLPAPLNLTGYSWQTSLRYEVPLPRWGAYRHSLVGGFDFKRSNNNLTFGGQSVFAAATDVAAGSIGYDASLRDRLGATSARGTVFMSPGGMSSQDNNAAYATSRAGARAHYTYAKLELNRTTGLPWDFTFVDLVTLQASEVNLLPSEQIGFGGYDTIRGYDTRVLNTDAGYIISTELRTPSLRVLSASRRLKSADDKVQILGFLDYGAGSNHGRLPGERAETKLLSAGPGLRYTASTHVSFRVDYGWQLLNQAEASRLYPSRAHLGVVLSY